MAVRRCTAALALALAAACAGAQTYAGRAANVRGRIVAETWIDGAGPYSFLVDAGLKRPVIAADLAAQLALPTAPDPIAGGGAAAAAAYAGSMRIAEGIDNDETLAAMDLSALEARLGARVHGLLPAYQAGLEVTLNFDPPGVSWRSIVGGALEDARSGVVAMRVSPEGAPSAAALIGGRLQRDLEIDLSFGGDLALHESTIAALHPGGEARLLVTRSSTGAVERQARVDRIVIGRCAVRNAVATIVPDAAAERVGAGFLRHFGVTMNFEMGRLYLSPAGEAEVEGGGVVGFGVSPEARVAGWWLAAVAAEGPAEQAGIEAGDRIAAVNGLPLYDAPYDAVARSLAAPEGAGIVLTVLRTEGPLAVPLTAVRLL